MDFIVALLCASCGAILGFFTAAIFQAGTPGHLIDENVRLRVALENANILNANLIRRINAGVSDERHVIPLQ